MQGISPLILVQKYLGSLNVVESVRVALISKKEVTFYLKLRNTVEDLQKLINIGMVVNSKRIEIIGSTLLPKVVI